MQTWQNVYVNKTHSRSTYIHTCVHVHTHMHTFLCTCTHVMCMYTCVHCHFLHFFIHACFLGFGNTLDDNVLHVYMCVCTCTCVYTLHVLLTFWPDVYKEKKNYTFCVRLFCMQNAFIKCAGETFWHSRLFLRISNRRFFRVFANKRDVYFILDIIIIIRWYIYLLRTHAS